MRRPACFAILYWALAALFAVLVKRNGHPATLRILPFVVTSYAYLALLARLSRTQVAIRAITVASNFVGG